MTGIEIFIALMCGSGIAGAIGTIVAKRVRPKGERELALVVRLESALEMSDTRAKEADDRAKKSQTRELIITEFANKCVRHIDAGNPPPPPAWPQALLA